MNLVFIYELRLYYRTQISESITFVMGGFDTLALGSKILFGDNWFSDFNAVLHESSIYNVAQTTIASVAVFTGGMNSGFNKAANSAGVKPSCFVAGTLVMAVAGMVAIETIKSGDKVISTDPETMETSPKTVLETYIREVTTLVHLTVNGEEIVTTVDHPFYVQGRGFVEAGKLLVGDKLLDVNGNILLVEKFYIELTEKPVTVYNFQVEDFHTYHVSEFGLLVHNAGGYERSQKYSNNWSDESLSNTVDKIAPESKPVKTSSGKEIYNNPKTGKQVVYDTDGNYFRIEDTTLTGKRVYTDINGNQIPNNKIVNGKQIGISKSEYNQLTHFNNID